MPEVLIDAAVELNLSHPEPDGYAAQHYLADDEHHFDFNRDNNPVHYGNIITNINDVNDHNKYDHLDTISRNFDVFKVQW